MAQLRLYGNKTTGITAIPNNFIDIYMPDAAGEDVKVFLYLFKQAQLSGEITLSSLTENLGMTKKMIMESLKYWEQKNLIELTYGQNQILECINIKNSFYDIHGKSNTNQNIKISRSTAYNDPKKLLQQENIKELLFIAESYLQKPLKDEDIQFILSWIIDLKLSHEMIEYVFEYCISKNHTSFYYMDKVAKSWAENSYKNKNEALSASTQYVTFHNAIKNIFKLNFRAITDNELKYIAKWKTDWNFSEELILAACQKTMNTINKCSFPYTDRILSNWLNNNVKTAKDVEELEKLLFSNNTV